MYYYYDIKMINKKINFFYKKTKRYNLKIFLDWNNRINMIAKSKKENKFMEETKFFEKLKLIEITKINYKNENIIIYQNENILLYKIESRENIKVNFKTDVLLEKTFYVNRKHLKYAIIKNKGVINGENGNRNKR